MKLKTGRSKFTTPGYSEELYSPPKKPFSAEAEAWEAWGSWSIPVSLRTALPQMRARVRARAAAQVAAIMEEMNGKISEKSVAIMEEMHASRHARRDLSNGRPGSAPARSSR